MALGRENRQGRFDDAMLLVGDPLSTPFRGAACYDTPSAASAVVQSAAMASWASGNSTAPSHTSWCSFDSTASFAFGEAPGSGPEVSWIVRIAPELKRHDGRTRHPTAAQCMTSVDA
jgi:hypothetical protein